MLKCSERWKVSIEFKPQDMWIGAYWKRQGYQIDVWVCLLPCLPIHIAWWCCTGEPDPRWEAVPDDDGKFWRVRWSEPDGEGRYLWVGHYGQQDTRIAQHMAERDAERKNKSGKTPWEYPEYQRKDPKCIGKVEKATSPDGFSPMPQIMVPSED